MSANIYAATGSTETLAESEMFPAVFGQLARVGGEAKIEREMRRAEKVQKKQLKA